MNNSKVFIAIIVVILFMGGAIVLSQQSKSTSTSTPTSNNTSQSQPADTAPSVNSDTTQSGNVKMTNMMFTPSQITVKKGSAVTWTNDDKTTHTVIVDQGEGPSSNDIAPGATYSYTFTQAGSYQYHCGIHSSMRGTIVVQ